MCVCVFSITAASAHRRGGTINFTETREEEARVDKEERRGGPKKGTPGVFARAPRSVTAKVRGCHFRGKGGDIFHGQRWGSGLIRLRGGRVAFCWNRTSASFLPLAFRDDRGAPLRSTLTAPVISPVNFFSHNQVRFQT